jgi:hypothetical protein
MTLLRDRRIAALLAAEVISSLGTQMTWLRSPCCSRWSLRQVSSSRRTSGSMHPPEVATERGPPRVFDGVRFLLRATGCDHDVRRDGALGAVAASLEA